MKIINYIYKKISIPAVALFFLLVPNACQRELLDPVPQNSFSEFTIWNTPDRFRSNINGVYDAAKNGWLYGSRSIVYQDIRAEDFINELTNVVTGFSVYNHSQVESDNAVNQVWAAAYYAINSANICLEGINENKAVLGNDALAVQYEGEVRFIRALMYQLLLQFYARPYADGNGSQPGVPLRLRAETAPGNNDLERATVAEVYTQILADLDFAEQNLPTTQGTALNNTTRAHKNTAIALKTRVLLAMQRYNDVITEANKIVPDALPFVSASGVAHALQADIKTVFTSYTTTESILSFPFTSNDLPGTQNGLGYYFTPAPKGNGEYSLNPNGIIKDSVAFAGNDVRRSFVTKSGTKFFWTKYNVGPELLDYAPVIRYAEVLFNLAESIAKTQGVTQRAVDLLNAVRTRSNPAGGYTLGNFADADAFLSALRTEHRIEFMGEGQRAFMLTRQLLPLPGKANVSAVNPTDPDYIWPIPQSELAANRLMTANP